MEAGRNRYRYGMQSGPIFRPQNCHPLDALSDRAIKVFGQRSLVERNGLIHKSIDRIDLWILDTEVLSLWPFQAMRLLPDLPR